MSSCASRVSQVSSLGLTTFGVGGIFQVSGSVTVEAGGLTVSSGGLTVVGTTQLHGTASIEAIDPDVNAATFQVFASSAAATGDVIAGRVHAAATGNVLTLLEGANVLFNVRLLDRFRRAITFCAVSLRLIR